MLFTFALLESRLSRLEYVLGGRTTSADEKPKTVPERIHKLEKSLQELSAKTNLLNDAQQLRTLDHSIFVHVIYTDNPRSRRPPRPPAPFPLHPVRAPHRRGKSRRRRRPRTAIRNHRLAAQSPRGPTDPVDGGVYQAREAAPADCRSRGRAPAAGAQDQRAEEAQRAAGAAGQAGAVLGRGEVLDRVAGTVAGGAEGCGQAGVPGQAGGGGAVRAQMLL